MILYISNKNYGHFLGSILYIENNISTITSNKKYMIIDGQQRLTTITLLYIALYHFLDEIEEEDDKIKTIKMKFINIL